MVEQKCIRDSILHNSFVNTSDKKLMNKKFTQICVGLYYKTTLGIFFGIFRVFAYLLTFLFRVLSFAVGYFFIKINFDSKKKLFVFFLFIVKELFYSKEFES